MRKSNEGRRQGYSRQARTPVQRLAHDLANSLAALRLRVELVMGDETCRRAQGANLTAIARILEDTRALAAKLEDAAAPPAVTVARRSPR
jgi:hypothetical protein